MTGVRSNVPVTPRRAGGDAPTAASFESKAALADRLGEPEATVTRSFFDADQLLLDEARGRYDFEQKASLALQAKSTFFLALAGAFAAFVGTAIWRLADRAGSLTLFEVSALGMLALAFALFSLCAVLLARSALSISYGIIASPAHWVAHLHAFRKNSANGQPAEEQVCDALRHAILDAWIVAIEDCLIVNASKAKTLSHVAIVLSAAVPLVVVATLLLILSAFGV